MNDEGWWGGGLLAAGDPRAQWARAGADAVSFRELRARTAWLAGVLPAHGIRTGSTVALHGTPSFTQLWVVCALWSLGAQVVLLEPSVSRAERRALLELSDPQFVITLGELLGDEDRFAPECEVLVRRRQGGRPARTDHCVVQFSSGTTGRPKAAGRTASSLLAEVRPIGALPLAPRGGERVAVLEPVARSFALIGGVLHALATGATVVFPTSGGDAAVVAAAADADVVVGGPRQIAQLANAPAGTRLPRLRLAVSGGDALPVAGADAFARRYGVRVGQAYGTTETGVVATDLAGVYGPGAIGVPLPGVRTRVVAGALQVYVPASPYPYEPWPALAGGGWLPTHDLVARDAATGAWRLRGRDGRTSSGEYLVDIEAVLLAHRDVRDAVVLGPDPVEAHVAGSGALQRADLAAWCRRFLREAAVPQSFHVVPELARSASGKVLRDRARLHGRGWAPRPDRVGRGR